MQLRVARLCLDCDEIHDLAQCPVCASESFTYLTRWVPVPEPPPRSKSSNDDHDDVEVYRQLMSGNGARTRGRGKRLLKRGAVALTVLGVVGWWWQSEGRKSSN